MNYKQKNGSIIKEIEKHKYYFQLSIYLKKKKKIKKKSQINFLKKEKYFLLIQISFRLICHLSSYLKLVSLINIFIVSLQIFFSILILSPNLILTLYIPHNKVL